MERQKGEKQESRTWLGSMAAAAPLPFFAELRLAVLLLLLEKRPENNSQVCCRAV